VQRDERNHAALSVAGWRVFEVWECEVSENTLAKLVAKIRG
jgi:G:T-mismatch repair DNA endonuclease (very short patch repair protein)